MKSNKFKHRLASSLFLGIALVSSAISLPAAAHDRYDYRSASPVSSFHTYQHIYYPEYRSYYSPHSRTWFWLEGSRWYSGLRLPFAINMRIGGIPVSLTSAIPYYEHNYVETRYAQPIYRIRHKYRHHHDARGDRDYRERDDDDYRRHDHHQRW